MKRSFSDIQGYVEQTLKQYATKAELEQVNTEIARAESRIIRWTVGTDIAVSVLIVAAVGIMLNADVS